MKDYYENNRERLRDQTKYKYRNLSERENMEKTDIIICLKKINKTKRIPKKVSRDKKFSL